LSLFFGTSREGLVDLGGWRDPTLFLKVFNALVQFFDALVGGFESTAQVGDQIDEPFGADPPLFHIQFERLDSNHTPSILANPADLGEHRFHRMHSYRWN
jgi:hypothetical protein